MNSKLLNSCLRKLSVPVVLSLGLVLSVPASSTAQEEIESFGALVAGVRPNFVEGDVQYKRENGTSKLDLGLELKEGDVITTAAGSRAEVLLQPGNYLRIGPDSEVRLLGVQYDRLRFELSKGTMVFELLRNDADRSSMFLDTPGQAYELIRVLTTNGQVLISRPGVYRVNLTSDGRTEVATRRGELVFNGEKIKEKRLATVGDGRVSVTEVDFKTEDAFDSWCRERAQKLIAVNHSLKKEAPWVKARKAGTEAVPDVAGDAEKRSNPNVVSARPGTVNFVDDGVEFKPKTEVVWQPLQLQTVLDSGDRVRTAAFSHVELMMLPDVYFRLDGDSEVVLEQITNETISLKVFRGAVILDVGRIQIRELPIYLGSMSNSIRVIGNGNYRFDMRNGSDEITVRKGRVVFREQSIGSCRKILGGVVAECDKEGDSFDFWSKHRGEGESFNGRTMTSFLLRIRRQRYRNTGFWYQHSPAGYYTFVPYSSTYFRSPYGGSYSSVFSPRSGLSLPRIITRVPQYTPPRPKRP